MKCNHAPRPGVKRAKCRSAEQNLCFISTEDKLCVTDFSEVECAGVVNILLPVLCSLVRQGSRDSFCYTPAVENNWPTCRRVK
jgi:hypothetical protein